MHTRHGCGELPNIGLLPTSTESHVFVFVTTVSAYVIPKNAVSSGALDSFVARLRERIEGAGGRA
jgi:hypothetical protein